MLSAAFGGAFATVGDARHLVRVRAVLLQHRVVDCGQQCWKPTSGEQLSRSVDGSRTDPAVVGVWVDVAAAHDGDDVPVGEAVTVFEDRRDAERGRRFGDEASVVQEHPHAGDDRRLPDQDGVVSDQQEIVQDGRDGTPRRRRPRWCWPGRW